MEVTRILIKLAEGEERLEAVRFANSVAQKWYGCNFPPPPPTFFAAKIGTEIVGTTALDFAEEGQALPLETIYTINYGKTPWPLLSQKTAQYGRLTAAAPNVSICLTYAATIYAISKGKIYGLAEIKDRVAVYQRSLGADLRHIPEASLMPERIPEDGKAYYLKPPPPKLYMMRLKQFKECYGARAVPLFSENKAALEEKIKEILNLR